METTTKINPTEKLIINANNITDIDSKLAKDFNAIIINKVEGYSKDKTALKSFFNDLQHSGCISGLIGDFIYHADCKAFYIKHIDALESFKEELEEQLGEPIANRHNVPHYTFMCWLCFEECCYNLYNAIFES